MTAPVIRWRGGPGAGKSSALLEYVRSEITAGAMLDDFTLMTFSRSQAADLINRLHHSIFPDASLDTLRSRCATIDAMALRACRDAGLIGDSREVIIQPGDQKKRGIFTEFMNAHDLEYNPAIGTENYEEGLLHAEIPIGNQLLTLNAYLSSTGRPPEDWQMASATLGLPILPYAWPIIDLLHAWKDYKARLGVYEHADYVALALRHALSPPSPILIIDEYQDVSPVQDALIRHWIDHPDTSQAYVAGDEDQSIYGFRGCDPSLLQGIPAIDHGAQGGSTRPTSYRCPEDVMKTAELILNHPANVAPCNRRGIVRHVGPTAAEDLAAQIEEAIRYIYDKGQKGPIFILCRFKKHVRSLANVISTAGIPCSSIRPHRVKRWEKICIGSRSDGSEPITINPWELTQAIKRYLEGCDLDLFPKAEAEVLIEALLSGRQQQAALMDLKIKSKTREIRRGDLFQWFNGIDGPGIFHRLNLPKWMIKQIQACIRRDRRRGYSLSPHGIKIDTIHAPKGLEASVVMLHTGYLSGRMNGLTDPARAAEERRIYFTGATRAADALLLLDYGKGPRCPFLIGVTG